MVTILSRRQFLERSLRASLVTAAAACFQVPTFLRQALAEGHLPMGDKKLLFIFLRGGNDGLNNVVPVLDDAYYNYGTATASKPTRQDIDIPRDPQAGYAQVTGQAPVIGPAENYPFAIPLGNGFAGLHPALRDLAPLYNDHQLALIHRVGYPRQSRSHFDSQRYWENGMPRNTNLREGILYRALVNTGLYQGRKFSGVSVQNSMPVLLRGRIVMTNLADVSRYDLLGVADSQNVGGHYVGADKDKLLASIAAEHLIPYPEKNDRDLVFSTGLGLKDSIEALKAVGTESNDFFDQDGKTHLFPIDTASNQKGFGSGAYGFFNNLKVAAQVLASTDAVVAGTELSSFDTHNNQGGVTGSHANLLARLGWGFYALRQFFSTPEYNLAKTNLWKDVVVITLSEFGRTTIQNGSAGTDHAEASVMYVAGGAVKGGVYQCSPDQGWVVGPTGSMFQVNNRYLRRSVDYRSVLGEIVRDHLGASASQLATIIPGYADPNEHLQGGGRGADGTAIVGELGLV